MPIRPDSEELTIKTAGRILGGWLGVRVSRGVERLPSGYVVSLTERYPGQIGQVATTPGSTCEVFLGADLILTGYVDKYAPGYSAGQHEVSLIGRSKTEDVVDCSVDVDAVGVNSWELKAATIGEAAKKIVKPLGITVTLPDGDAKLDPKYPFIMNPGMTCYQLIEEVAATVQMLVWDNEKGELVISKVGTKRAGTALVEGINIEAAAAGYSMDQRYNEIRVIGQIGSSQDTQTHQLHTNSAGDAFDPNVRAGRLLVIVTDLLGPEAKWAQQRAKWEISRRYGRSRQIQVTVTGWRGQDGQLWTPNTIVAVNCPTLKMKQDLVIAECAWARGPQGTQTMMTLMPKEGLEPQLFYPPLFLAPGTVANP